MALPFLILTTGRRARRLQASGGHGYGASGGEQAVSAALALAIAGGVGTALMLALVAPGIDRPGEDDMVVHSIPVPQPPQPPVDTTSRSTNGAPSRPITTVAPRFDLPVDFTGPITPAIPDPPFTGSFDAGGIGTGGTGTGDPAPHVALFRPAQRDPRFAGRFQPPYPPAMQREEVEGLARVRVTIGPDGRVSAIDDLGSTTDAFFAATRRQALSQWRFVPATRDGVPVQSVQELTVRFVIPR